MRRRLVVVTELIAPYRIPVFNALAQQCELELHVIFLAHTDTSTRQWRVYEDEIQFSYEVLPNWRKRMGRYNLLLNRGLREALERASPDVIVCGGYNYLSSWQVCRWAKHHKVRLLLWSESTANDSRAKHVIVERLKRYFIRQCDGFVVPGIAARSYLRDLGAPSERIFMAHNAVDVSYFSSRAALLREAPERIRLQLGLPARFFLFVGRLVQAKGVLDLLEAYGKLPSALRSEISLVYAGDGPLRATLECRAQGIHPGSVHFAGFVHREDLPSYYGLAECLVLPTYSDTWGMVVNEAMACGLPIICSAVAGCAPDLIGANGRLVSPGNTNELGRAMEELARNPELRSEMSHESGKLIHSYCPQKCAAGFSEAVSAQECHA